MMEPPIKHARGELTVYEQEQAELRASSLPTPTIKLSGHSGSVYSLAYNPSGETLISTSFDKTCLLWNHADYLNYNTLEGHKNAVLDCSWCDDETVVTASADKTLMLWDALTGKRLRKWQKHTGVVNACTAYGYYYVSSVSDDGLCLLWDRRQKSPVATLETEYPLTAVACSNDNVFSGGIDNKILCWDLKMHRKVYAMKGHTETITSLAMHPEKTHLLSNGMDNKLHSWDIQPFVSDKSNRLVKTFEGHRHSMEKGLLKCSWSRDGMMVSCGSADKMVHVWDEYSTDELYLLPGHHGCVNTVTFHPVENVIASGSSDKTIYVGELS